MKFIKSFSIGDKVEVIGEHLQSFGLIGVVNNNNLGIAHPNCIEIYFEKWANGESKYIKIKKENLKKYEGEKNMVVKGNYKIAVVVFLQGTNTTKRYAFALFDDNVKFEDLVLCDTSYGYNVGKVVDIISQEEYVGVDVTKEIICKVDFTAFEGRKEARKRKESIKAQMDKLVKQNQELVLYQMLAEQNPEMATMLEEYKKYMDV